MTTDLLDMVWDRVSEAREKLETMSPEEEAKIGVQAFEFIQDYPLYANGDGLTYNEAILIALVIGGDDFLAYLEEDRDA